MSAPHRIEVSHAATAMRGWVAPGLLAGLVSATVLIAGSMILPRISHPGTPPGQDPLMQAFARFAADGHPDNIPEHQTPPAPDETPDSDTPLPEPRRPVEPPIEPPVEPGPGELVIIRLKEGKSFSGVLLDGSGGSIVVDVNGLRITIPRADITEIAHKPTRFDEYARLRAAINSSDVIGMSTLVRWLIEQELFEEAIQEAEALLRARLSDADAARLLQETQATVQLRQREQRTNSGDASSPASELERRRQQLTRDIELVRFGTSEFPVLNREQVNLIKVFEVNISNPPRLRITHDVIDRLFQEYGEHPLVPESRRARDAFRRKPASEILDVMFRAQARTLYGQVQVIGNPDAMERFRDDVHGRWLINSCASTRCHGGKGAGRFVLRNIRQNTEETFYTNFLILDRYRTAQGLPLINWTDPPRSPLFHYALPRDDALFPHPQVEGWLPVIRSRSHRNFQDSVDWVRSMYLPRPDYGIEFESPTDLAERLAREQADSETQPPPPQRGPER